MSRSRHAPERAPTDAPTAPSRDAAVGAAASVPGAPPDAMRLTLELEIPSDVRYIEPTVGVVQRECQFFEFPPHHCSLNVPVALSEALSNAILRGNGEDPRKAVQVRAEVNRAGLVVEVRDEGPGFDLESATSDPTAPENLLREEGRGLFLMRALMDDVERYDDEGNVVRLTLRRP